MQKEKSFTLALNEASDWTEEEVSLEFKINHQICAGIKGFSNPCPSFFESSHFKTYLTCFIFQKVQNFRLGYIDLDEGEGKTFPVSCFMHLFVP